MAHRTNQAQPNPAFLVTQTLGTRNPSDYVQHPHRAPTPEVPFPLTKQRFAPNTSRASFADTIRDPTIYHDTPTDPPPVHPVEPQHAADKHPSEARAGVRRKHTWRPMVSPPRFSHPRPIAKPFHRCLDPASRRLVPVEDRLRNALGILALGLLLTTAAGIGLVAARDAFPAATLHTP